MKELTSKEEEVMNFFWKEGPLFVKDIVAAYPEPRPHFNTISTIVRGLEEKGFVSHKAYGKSYQYYPVVSERRGVYFGQERGHHGRRVAQAA